MAAGGAGLAEDTAALAPAVAAYETISGGAKTFILKAARAVNARRSFDGGGLLDEMAAAWQQGMESLAGLVV